MEKIYKSLYLTDNMQKAVEYQKMGRYVVLCYPLKEIKKENIEVGQYHFPYALENYEEVSDDQLERILLRFENKPWQICETKRCRIREITVEDVDTLYEIYKEPEITVYMEDLYADKEQEIAYTKDYIRYHYGFYEFGMWIIEEKETGIIIGRAGFDMKEDGEFPEIGFMIRKEYQGKGYAYEVCSKIIKYGCEELDFSTIVAFVEPENKASVSLLNKLGFEMGTEDQKSLVKYIWNIK